MEGTIFKTQSSSYDGRVALKLLFQNDIILDFCCLESMDNNYDFFVSGCKKAISECRSREKGSNLF